MNEPTLLAALAEHAETIESCLEVLLPSSDGLEAPLYAAMRYATWAAASGCAASW
jgi:hypothetical protein